MTAFIEALLRFFQDFSGRRALGLFIIVMLFVGGFLLYDRYTASSTLGRLDHIADLITKLQTIEANPVKRSPELESAYQSLRTQVTEAVANKPLAVDLLPANISDTARNTLKFACGSLPWFLICLVMLPKTLRGDSSALGGLVAVGLLAIIFGLFALLVPMFWWPWGNLIIYPIFHPVVVLFIVALIGMHTGRKKQANTSLQQHDYPIS